MSTQRWLILLPFFVSFSICYLSATEPENDILQAKKIAQQASSLALSNPDSSLLLLHQAQKIFVREKDLYNWLDALYNVAYELPPAQAIELCKTNSLNDLPFLPSNEQEWELLGSVYMLWAYSHQALGQFYDARLRYEKALFVFDEKLKKESLRTAAYLHRELGNIYTRFGDYEAAFVLLGQAKRTAIRFGDYNLAAEIFSDIGIALLDMGRGEEAVDSCLAALRMPSLSAVSKGLLETTLATALQKENRPAQATSHALQAKSHLEKVVKNDLHPAGKLWLSGILKLLAELDPSHAAAGSRYQQAFDLMKISFNGDTLRREFGKLRLSWANHYLMHGQVEKALVQQQLALQSVLPGFLEKDPILNPRPEKFYPENTIMEALGGKAEVFNAMFHRTGEGKWIEKSLECHELLFSAEQVYRRVHHYESSKLAMLDEASHRTEKAINAAWEASELEGGKRWLEQALAFSEKSKGLLLFEALRNAGANTMANIPADLLFQEKQLTEQISQMEKELYMVGHQQLDNTGIKERLRHEILLHNQELSNLRRKIEREYPEFYHLKYQQAAISVAEVQQLLQPDQAVIEYFVGDTTLFIFLIKSSDFQVVRLKKDFPLESWAAQFRRDIEAFQFFGNNRDSLCQTYSNLGVRLYQKLLQPVEHYGLPTNLLIVPGGILGFLPFDALLYQTPDAACLFKQYPYLALRHNISYNYSLSLLKELRSAKKQPTAASLAAFAPSFPDGNQSVFGPLEFNLASAEAAASLFSGTACLSDDASLQAFRERAALHSILYLATHAKANSGDGDFSFIIMSDGSGGYDTMFVNDIYNMDLAAELVFLGACETGNGQFFNGEGIISLARSFLYAGAKSVVTTLWSINDESNKELTVSFFRHLKSGKQKDLSLWKAKLEQLKNTEQDLYAHPVYWAAYTPIGDMATVSGSGVSSSWLLSAAIGIIGLSLSLLYLKRKQAVGSVNNIQSTFGEYNP